LTTFDAKGPDTSYPPISPLWPPAAAPNVLTVLIEDLWAAPFAAAVRDSGGVLLEGARVPHELAEEAFAGVEPVG
jgi:hypothetical protein